MFADIPELMEKIRGRFSFVETCPVQGPRIFFENAGGSLTLKSVVDRSAEYAAIPDNQGRDNPASQHLMQVIDEAKTAMRTFFGAQKGQVFVGESGTELLFRLLRSACLGTQEGGRVIGSTLEHPASRSAALKWADNTKREYKAVTHNPQTGTVTVADYQRVISHDTRVATIIHTSPVTGVSVDVAAIAKAIREVSANCIIIVDGIQHAAHGGADIDGYNIDGYVISPYKVYSRHGYGVAWISDRLTEMPHDMLIGGPEAQWELGTRDAGAYATFSDVVDYLDWLGGQVSDAASTRARIEAAGQAISAQEKKLVDLMLAGNNMVAGLAAIPEIEIIGGVENPHREGLVSFALKDIKSERVVAGLSELGIRVHIRKPDHYSGNILKPLGLDSCVRVSMCHYNTETEVTAFLKAIEQIRHQCLLYPTTAEV